MPSDLISNTSETFDARQAFLGRPRTVGAGRGVQWWRDAWRLFKGAPGTWVVMGVVLIVISLFLQFIPLVSWILNSCFVAGFMVASAHQYDGGKPEIKDLFAGFQKKLVPLVLSMVAVMLPMFVLGVVVGVFIGIFSFGGGLLVLPSPDAYHSSMGAVLGGWGLAIVLLVALVILFCMVIWFAPVLIIQHDYGVIEALKTSLKACAINWLAFLLYGLVFMVLALFATLLLGLGWLVLLPLMYLSIYSAYRNIFYPV